MEKTKRMLIKPGSKLDAFFSKRFDSSLFTYREIFSMLIPIILDQFFISAIGLLTTSMISSSSQESVSAVSLIGPIQTMCYAIFNAVAAGGTVVVAQYKGRGDEEKTRRAAGQVILGTVGIAMISCIFLVIFAAPIVDLMFGAADELVKTKARDYLIGVSISMIPFSFYLSSFSAFRGVGKTKICLRLTIVINVIHLFASMLFINVLKLDIVGTALSLNIARVIGGAVAMYALMKKNSPLRVTVTDILKINGSMLKSILKVGVPFGMEQLFFSGGNVLVQMYMVGLGTVAVAAYAITNSAIGLMYVAAASVGTLAITVCGRCIGAGDKDTARRYGKNMIGLATVLLIVSIIVFYPLLPYILKLYQAPAETLSIIYNLIIIGVASMPFFYPMANVMPCVLRSAGDASFSSMTSLITMWVVKVFIGYILGIVLDFGVMGIYCCLGLEWAVKAVVYAIRFKGDKWLNKKTID